MYNQICTCKNTYELLKIPFCRWYILPIALADARWRPADAKWRQTSADAEVTGSWHELTLSDANPNLKQNHYILWWVEKEGKQGKHEEKGERGENGGTREKEKGEKGERSMINEIKDKREGKQELKI